MKSPAWSAIIAGKKQIDPIIASVGARLGLRNSVTRDATLRARPMNKKTRVAKPRVVVFEIERVSSPPSGVSRMSQMTKTTNKTARTLPLLDSAMS